MKVKKELEPKITRTKENKYYVYFWYNNERFRFHNGKVIGEALFPNHMDHKKRFQEAELLKGAFSLAIRKGWRPEPREVMSKELLVKDIAKAVLKRKLSLDYSKSYKTDLIRTERLWSSFISQNGLANKRVSSLSTEVVANFVYLSAPSAQSKRNLKRNISALLKDELESSGIIINLRRIKIPSKGQELHKPIGNVSALLNEIKAFNDNLYLCCLMTYGMLLRPHREIRCLRFSDFNEDFSVLSLNGQRVKSKKNRVLPVPSIIRAVLLDRYKTSKSREHNVFSLDNFEHHNDYFKGWWTKYKKQSIILQPNQTLYSFRHTGAIKVFEKTGSLQKLQQVMGHSDMKVSLTYLRGLEVKQLDVEDLPEL